MKAPAGAVVRIFYDGALLYRGDGLRTPTGRLYLVLSSRLQRRGQHQGRQHLACLVAGPGDAPPSRVLPLHWYPRRRSRP